VLTADPVRMLEKSGGSTAASKYIPYTDALKSEFGRATSAWLNDLLLARPRLRGLGAYWSVSPVAREREVTPGGLKVGFEDDTEYFGALERWVLGAIMRVPGPLRNVPSMASNRYVTLRHLLNTDDLGLISVWNPTFLTLLLQAAETEGDRLVRDLRSGTLTPPEPLEPALQAALSAGLVARPRTADRLEAALRGGRLLGTDLWPKLQLVSCWTDAVAQRFVPELAARFPGVEIQGKGLLATEGVVSFPLVGHPGALLAIDSHFMEFVPEGGEGPVLADALEPGARYTVLLTTGGGLTRYALHDQVAVVGRVGATPLVQFLGKAAKVSDVVGEKLNELHVGAAIERVLAARGVEAPFAMLAPEVGSPSRYVAYLQLDASDAGAVARALDAELRENHHYAYARDLGQLGAIEAVAVGPEAHARYIAGCEALGQRAGDVKPCYLHRDVGWRSRLAPQESLPHGL
jgi:hypothetical protein